MAVIAADSVQTAPAITKPVIRSGRKLSHVQAFRGVSASLVAISHSIEALAQRHLVSDNFAARASHVGYFGVAAFFMISGFVIYKTSKRDFGTNPLKFLGKRLIRIMPLYWIATLLFFILSPHRAEFTLADVLLSMALIPHFIPSVANMHPLVGQAWTLQYEMLFYIVFCAGLFFDRVKGRLLIAALLIGLVAVGSTIMGMTDSTESVTIVQYWTRPIILLFLAGIGFGVLEERFGGKLVIPHAFLLMMGVLVFWFVFRATVPIDIENLLRLPAVLMVWAMCATVVFISVFGQGSPGKFEAFAGRFGDASYSIFLFHTFVLSALLRLKIQDMSPLLFVVAAVIGSIGLGSVVFYLVERPMLRTLRRTLLKEA